jgi:hypothetical protein
VILFSENFVNFTYISLLHHDITKYVIIADFEKLKLNKDSIILL